MFAVEPMLKWIVIRMNLTCMGKPDGHVLPEGWVTGDVWPERDEKILQQQNNGAVTSQSLHRLW